MDAWQRFLKDIDSAQQIHVVGPLLKGTFLPTGPTVFIDGGLEARSPFTDQKIHVISVGDGDSTAKALDFLLPKDKDLSDLAFVLRALPKNIRHVELHGFLGGRRDHELANFGEAHRFLKDKEIFTTVRFDESLIGFSGDTLTVDIFGLFSIMVFERCALTIKGACKYPLLRPTFFTVASSRGLSNEGSGSIRISASEPCFLFQ